MRKKPDIDFSCGGTFKQNNIYINKLIIKNGKADYTPSFRQVIGKLLGLSDYKKDTRNALDNMGLKNIELE